MSQKDNSDSKKSELRETPKEFETLSTSIVRCLLRDTSAEISDTRPNKDGGYDIYVNYYSDNVKKQALFECKLRSNNLSLRDIAANVIIAFNHGAMALVAMTNHDFTQQAGEEIFGFSKRTILNIKIITGKEILNLTNKYGLTISDKLNNYFNLKRNYKKDNFDSLRINFNTNITEQIFYINKEQFMHDLVLEDIYREEINEIVSLIERRASFIVSGYKGIGKLSLIEAAIQKEIQILIEIDVSIYESKDILALDILAKIWGIPSRDVIMSFSKENINDITSEVGFQKNEKEIAETIASILNDNLFTTHFSERTNYILVEYIIDLIKIHSSSFEYVFLITNLSESNDEVNGFLRYFIKILVENKISCIIHRNIPEYALQKDILINLGLKEYKLKPFEEDAAIQYLTRSYQGLTEYIAKEIIKRVGTRLYNLKSVMTGLFQIENKILQNDSKTIVSHIQSFTPNSIPNLISNILQKYSMYNQYVSIFLLFVIFEGRIPLKYFSLTEIPIQNLDNLVIADILKCESGLIVQQNEFVKQWINEMYSAKMPGVQEYAKNVLEKIEKDTKELTYEFVNALYIVGRYDEALELLDKSIAGLKKKKQYSALKKNYIIGITITDNCMKHEKKVSYIISLLEIIVIQKEIDSIEADYYVKMLETYIGDDNNHHKKYAFDYFKFKKAVKTGLYNEQNSESLISGKKYYESCLKHELNDNEGDWLGRICATYALMIKETQGNEKALIIFEHAMTIFSDSFELRRGYYSHIACMKLYKEPLCAFSYYQDILSLFKNEAPDSAALPYHEYGDQAMCMLISGKLKEAMLLSTDALKISRSNGILDEEGRCLNTLGCVQWCSGDEESAQKSFKEAIDIMNYSGYTHYVWRSRLNLLQIMVHKNEDETICAEMFKNVYQDFKLLLSGKIKNLIKESVTDFLQTREYHALLIIGLLSKKLKLNNEKNIIHDFGLQSILNQYKNHIKVIISKKYDAIKSPYIQDGFIYIVG